MLGLVEDAERALGSAFQKEGDAIVLLDGAGKWSHAARDAYWKDFSALVKNSPQLEMAAIEKRLTGPSEDWRAFSSSEYAKTIHGIVAGAPPAMDLAAEKRLIECLVAVASEGAILSAHDVSDGGLAVTLAESCFGAEGLAAVFSLEGDEPAEAALFGERGARAVVSLSPASLARVSAIAAQYKVNAQRIGTVTRGEFRIQYNGASVISGDVNSLRKVWSESLVRAVEGTENK